MNYNEIFEDNVLKDFYYNADNYPKKILVDGFIDLDKAKKRLEKGEYYILVLYQNGEELPKEYIPVPNQMGNIEMESDKKFATVNPDEVLNAYCVDNSIQRITNLQNSIAGARYLLGAGPEEISLPYLLQNQIDSYKKMTITR